MISKDNIQISVVLPKVVVEWLDKQADVDFLTRSKEAAKLIIDMYKLEGK